MREREARAVLLVRAVEETDPQGRVLPEAERAAATRQAWEELDASESAPSPTDGRQAVVRRALTLAPVLERRFAAVRRALAATGGNPGIVALTCALAFALGLATNVLGPQRQINLLAAPLLGLLAWNLLVYLLLLLRPWRRPRRRDGGTRGGPIVDWLAGKPWAALVPGRTSGRDGTGSTSRILGRALVRFGAAWSRGAGTLTAARIQRALHLAALTMVAGAVGGMYLRGIAFEYRATWESTLLDAGGVQTLLDGVLGPAAALLGRSVPDVAPLESPGSGEAAPWLHLYAVTTALLVGLPRLLLAIAAGWRARRLASNVAVELDESYVRRLFAEWRGATRIVQVLSYSFRPGPPAAERLKALLHAFFGARAHVEIGEALEYGAEVDTAARPQPSDDRAAEVCRVVLFNQAQTPEREVHGEFLRALKTATAERQETLLALLDGSAFRLAVISPRRNEERLAAWREIAGDAGLRLGEIDLSGSDDDLPAMLDSMGGALNPGEKR